MYAVGTIMTNHIGYCKDVINKAKRRTNTEQRGTFKMSRAVDEPSMIAVSWVDNNPSTFWLQEPLEPKFRYSAASVVVTSSPSCVPLLSATTIV